MDTELHIVNTAQIKTEAALYKVFVPFCLSMVIMVLTITTFKGDLGQKIGWSLYGLNIIYFLFGCSETISLFRYKVSLIMSGIKFDNKKIVWEEIARAEINIVESVASLDIFLISGEEKRFIIPGQLSYIKNELPKLETKLKIHLKEVLSNIKERP